MHNLVHATRKLRLNLSLLTWVVKPTHLCPGGLAEDAEAGYRHHPENTHLHHTVQKVLVIL